MRKKYTTIKTLAAFTALTGSIAPLYGYAQSKTIPSIELNFDVLERLQKHEEPLHAEKILVKPAAELADEERIVKPELKPALIAEKEAKEDIKETVKVEPKEKEVVIQPLASLGEQKKSDNAVQDSSRNTAEIKEDPVANKVDAVKQEKKGLLSSFFNKFSAQKTENKEVIKSEPSTQQQAVTIDNTHDVAQPDNKVQKPVDKAASKKGENKKEAKQKSSKKSQESSNKNTKKQAADKKSKDKEVAGKKSTKREQVASSVKTKPKQKEKAAGDIAKETRIAATPTIVENKKLQENVVQEEPKQEIVLPEVAKKEESSESIQKPLTQEQAKEESAWQFFLKDAKKKSDAENAVSENKNLDEKPLENSVNLVEKVLPAEDELAKNEVKQTSSDNKEKSDKAVQVKQEVQAEESGEGSIESQEKRVADAENEEISSDVLEAIQPELVKKEEKGYFASLRDKINEYKSRKEVKEKQEDSSPAQPEIAEPVIEEDKAEEPAIITKQEPEEIVIEDKSLQEEMAKSKKIIEKVKPSNGKDETKVTERNTEAEKKLGDAVDNKISANLTPSVPPVPEPAEMPIEMSSLTPPGDAAPVTLDSEKIVKPVTEQKPASTNNEVLLTIAFDGNNVALSSADKEQLNKLIQSVQDSGKRLKVMSYASGIDGEVNSARRISLQRAIAIRAQMIEAGLEKNRINVQAIGNNASEKGFANSANIYSIE